jgi:hypothetical protein
MRDRRLQGVETIVERQQRVLSEGDDDRFLFDCQNRGMWIFRPGAPIGNRRALLPFGDGLLIDAISLGQSPRLS